MCRDHIARIIIIVIIIIIIIIIIIVTTTIIILIIIILLTEEIPKSIGLQPVGWRSLVPFVLQLSFPRILEVPVYTLLITVPSYLRTNRYCCDRLTQLRTTCNAFAVS